MASKLILKNIKASIPSLLRNPASSAPLAQTILNIQLPIPTQSADRTPLAKDFISSFDGGFRIEVRGKPVIDDFDLSFSDVDEMVDSESDDEDSVGRRTVGSDDESSEEFCSDDYDDEDDDEPRD